MIGVNRFPADRDRSSHPQDSAKLNARIFRCQAFQRDRKYNKQIPNGNFYLFITIYYGAERRISRTCTKPARHRTATQYVARRSNFIRRRKNDATGVSGMHEVEETN